jgi:TP901 family phage tail tape measure protein
VLNNLGLGLVFTAKDLASGTIRNLNSNFKELEKAGGIAGFAVGRGLSSVKLGLAAATAGAIGLGVAFKAANTFTDFEFRLTGVGAVMRATAEEMDLLKNAAIQAGIATEFSPLQAVEGLQALGQAGQSATQATKTLIPVLDLAGASFGQVGVGGAATALVGVLNSYGIAADKATNVTDKLVRITQMSNFQIKDFEGGLATAGASAGVFNQSLDDTLVLMGLLRNRNIDASSSATALRESFRRLGSDKGAQKALSGLVDIFDAQTGKMRPVLDITSDLIEKTKNLTDQRRNAIVVEAFGARGLNAFAAIEKATYTERKNGIDVTLRGRDAIEAMRRSLEGAEGTAESFRHKLLDTFKGQQILLHGSMESLAIVAGDGFADAFKPIISGVIDAVNFITTTIEKMPAPLKRLVAQLFVGASILVSLVGVVLLAKGAMVLFGVTLGGIATAAAGAALAILPIVAAIGLVIGIIYAARKAFEVNAGGIADIVTDAWAKVKLTTQALIQVFTDGGFSGAVREDLNKLDNLGLKSFVKSLYGVYARLRNFFRNIKKGIDEAVGPQTAATFQALVEAVTHLAQALGLTDNTIDHLAAKESFKSWGDAGQAAGRGIVSVLDKLAKTVTAIVDAVSGAIDMWHNFGSELKLDSGFLEDMGNDLDRVSAALGLSGTTAEEAGHGWHFFGYALTGFVLGAVHSATSLFDALLLTLQALSHILEGTIRIVIGVFSASWNEAWFGIKQVTFGVVQSLLGMIFGLGRAVGGLLDAFGRLAGKDLGLSKGSDTLRNLQAEIGAELATSMGITEADRARLGLQGSVVGLGGYGPQPPPSPSTSPAVASAAGGAESALVSRAAIQGALVSSVEASGGRSTQVTPQIIQSTLILDGVKVGEMMSRVAQSERERTSVLVSVSE